LDVVVRTADGQNTAASVCVYYEVDIAMKNKPRLFALRWAVALKLKVDHFVLGFQQHEEEEEVGHHELGDSSSFVALYNNNDDDDDVGWD